MPEFKIYDADQITINVCGIPVAAGFGDGEFCRIEESDDKFTFYESTDGSVTRSKTLKRTAIVTLTLAQTAEANDALSALHNLDLAQPNGAGIGAFICRDRGGRAIYQASKCCVIKPPDVSFDREATTREWKIFLIDHRRFDGGN